MPTPTPTLDTWDDLNVNDPVFLKSKKEPADIMNDIECEGARAFLAAHPEFYATPFNGQMLGVWCAQRAVPITRKNLEVAHRDLAERGLLEIPATPQSGPLGIETVPVRGGSAVAPPTAEEAAFLKKVADDPALTDHARRKRDELLRRAAVAQRPKFRGGNEAPVVI